LGVASFLLFASVLLRCLRGFFEPVACRLICLCVATLEFLPGLFPVERGIRAVFGFSSLLASQRLLLVCDRVCVASSRRRRCCGFSTRLVASRPCSLSVFPKLSRLCVSQKLWSRMFHIFSRRSENALETIPAGTEFIFSILRLKGAL